VVFFNHLALGIRRRRAGRVFNPVPRDTRLLLVELRCLRPDPSCTPGLQHCWTGLFTLACIRPALLNSDQLPSCGVDTAQDKAARWGWDGRYQNAAVFGPSALKWRAKISETGVSIPGNCAGSFPHSRVRGAWAGRWIHPSRRSHRESPAVDPTYPRSLRMSATACWARWTLAAPMVLILRDRGRGVETMAAYRRNRLEGCVVGRGVAARWLSLTTNNRDPRHKAEDDPVAGDGVVARAWV